MNCSSNKMRSTRRDILSYLPDPIRSRIVSLLPMKEALRTDILSTRWRKISTSLLNLEFCSRGFNTILDFKNFVEKTLILHDDSDIQKFNLDVDVYVDTELISSEHLFAWVTFAIQHNVTDLTLRLEGMPRTLERLPLSFFTCNTLSRLSLSSCTNLNWPTSSYFPMLKCLFFQSVTFFDENVTSELFSMSTCPVLERLSIFDCEFNKIRTLSIYFSTLKYFRLYCQDPIIVNLSVQIISEFAYDSPLPPSISCGTLSSTSRVSLNFGMPDSTSDELALRNSVRKILAGLHNVQKLTLFTNFIEVLSRDPDLLDYLPASYSSLNDIFFVMMPIKSHVETIACLLMSSPNLQTLCITFKKENLTSSDIIRMQEHWQLNELSIAECLKNLKEVKLFNFGGRETEMDIVRHLLKSSCILEKICISYTYEIDQEKEKRVEITEKLSSFRRISPYATIKFL